MFKEVYPLGFTTEDVITYQKRNLKNVLNICVKYEYAIDVGANIGLITIQLASRFKNILAIEPIASTYECLKYNTRTYPQIQTLNVAISNYDGEIGFAGSLESSMHIKTSKEYSSKVQCLCLDSLDILGCDLLKIDVEGHELEVIQGAIETIKKYHPMIILEEVSSFKKGSANNLYKQYGKDFTQYLRQARMILEDMGYAVYFRQGHDFVLAYGLDFVDSALLLPSELAVDDHRP